MIPLFKILKEIEIQLDKQGINAVSRNKERGKREYCNYQFEIDFKEQNLPDKE